MEPNTNETPDQEVIELEPEQKEGGRLEGFDPALQKELHSGASWFYWIAGLTVVNTVMAFSGSEKGFVLGLAFTQGLDYGAREIGLIGMLIAVVIDLLMIGGFITFGIFAGKGHKWAFITGLVIYGLDTLLVFALLFADTGLLLGAVIHALALFYIIRGLRAAIKLGQIPRLDSNPGL